MTEGIVYVGKIVQIDAIPGADFIVSATVVCGQGGKWRGIVRKDQFNAGDLCVVYLPDAQIPPCESMKFMESSDWRVKMRRFKGAPSEVVIMPMCVEGALGSDVTQELGVTKYCKPIPPNLMGKAKGLFPGFIPKTDELNYQRHFDLVANLLNQPYYITEKADGSSTTAYRYKDQFGVCSRNLELMHDSNNGYWQIAERYRLQERLPEGYAIQWETCGPKIQSNPMGLKQIEGYAFSAYNIAEHRYLTLGELYRLCNELQFPMVPIIEAKPVFDVEGVELLGEGTYSNGKQREGVVVRSQFNVGHAPISFKVINLSYEK